MMAVHCLRAEFLIERRSAGLSAAEGLRLEEHLSSCEGCSEKARLLAGLRALSQEQPAALPRQARERAIEGALRATASARGVTHAHESSARTAWFGFAFAAAVALGFGMYW